MKKKTLSATGLVAAGLVAGIVLASNGAIAETTTATTLPTPTTSTGSLPTIDNPTTDNPRMGNHTDGTPDNDGDFGRHAGHGPRGGMNDRSATPVRDDEKALSDADAAKVKAAAEAAVAGGTVFRVETDAGDGEYEAHVAKADGTLVTVKFDANFKVIEVQDGMGLGDPRHAHTHSDPQTTTPTTQG